MLTHYNKSDDNVTQCMQQKDTTNLRMEKVQSMIYCKCGFRWNNKNRTQLEMRDRTVRVCYVRVDIFLSNPECGALTARCRTYSHRNEHNQATTKKLLRIFKFLNWFFGDLTEVKYWRKTLTSIKRLWLSNVRMPNTCILSNSLWVKLDLAIVRETAPHFSWRAYRAATQSSPSHLHPLLLTQDDTPEDFGYQGTRKGVHSPKTWCARETNKSMTSWGNT